MKRIVISIAVVLALVLGGMFASSASAQGPHGHGHRHHGHHGHHHGHHHHHWRPPVTCSPYGGGYYGDGYYGGGYSSHPGYYTRSQPRVGLYFGF